MCSCKDSKNKGKTLLSEHDFFYVIVKKGAFRIEIVEQWGKKMSDCLVLLRINRTFVANY